MNSTTNTIHIRPTTSVYATYRRLSYKPWYALAEFVDNSTQSYFSNKAAILENHISNNRESNLTIEVIYNNTENVLTIFDNAFGMEFEDFQRALVLDSPPTDKSGRSEFGMGLKTAACWFGSFWTVESTQLGSNRVLIASIDVNELSQSKAESIVYSERRADPNSHYTRITIRDVHQPIKGRTVTRVHEHLCSIYRQDIRSKEVKILWNGVPLTFNDAEIYSETDLSGGIVEWKKDLEFTVPWEKENTDLSVKGWIGIRKHGKQREAGFVLLRRGRVIHGGPDEGYKPSEIFGQGNTFRSQRLIGELHLDEWPVTQAKDGFDWNNGLEEALIDKLEVLCKVYMDKAETIRANTNITPKPISKPEMENASEKTKNIFQDNEFGNWVQEEIEKKKKAEEIKFHQRNAIPNSERHEILETPNIGEDNIHQEELRKKSTGPLIYTLNMDKTQWTFRLYWQNNVTESYWMSVGYPQEDEIDIYLNLLHPFFSIYVNDPGILELIQKLVISLALAEKMARISTSNPDGSIEPSDLRTFMNKILYKIALIKEVK
jgi:hypothetical protein